MHRMQQLVLENNFERASHDPKRDIYKQTTSFDMINKSTLHSYIKERQRKYNWFKSRATYRKNSIV